LIRRLQQSLVRRAGALWGRARTLAARLAGSDFVRKAAETYATRIAGIAVGFVTSVIVARLLGPEGRGQFAIAVALSAIGVQFGNLGLATSNTYFVSKDRGLLAVLLGNTFLVALGLGAVFSATLHVFLLGWPQLAPIRACCSSWPSCPSLGPLQLLLQNLLLGIQEVRRKTWPTSARGSDPRAGRYPVPAASVTPRTSSR
jgi:hypothetical protein